MRRITTPPPRGVAARASHEASVRVKSIACVDTAGHGSILWIIGDGFEIASSWTVRANAHHRTIPQRWEMRPCMVGAAFALLRLRRPEGISSRSQHVSAISVPRRVGRMKVGKVEEAAATWEPIHSDPIYRHCPSWTCRRAWPRCAQVEHGRCRAAGATCSIQASTPLDATMAPSCRRPRSAVSHEWQS